jgi:hypothetical protein
VLSVRNHRHLNMAQLLIPIWLARWCPGSDMIKRYSNWLSYLVLFSFLLLIFFLRIIIWRWLIISGGLFCLLLLWCWLFWLCLQLDLLDWFQCACIKSD